MDGQSELDIARKLIKKHLTPLGIEVDITLRADGTVVLSASKRFGVSVQNAVITGINLIDAVWRLIKYIEREIENWLDKETYGTV